MAFALMGCSSETVQPASDQQPYAAPIPYGVVYYDPANAYNGYTFFGSVLVDMRGNLIRKSATGDGGVWGEVYDDGHFLTVTATGGGRGGAGWSGGGRAMTLVEMDFDGNVHGKWSPAESGREELEPHHQYIRIFNPKVNDYTYLVLVYTPLAMDPQRRDISYQEAINNGADPSKGLNEERPPDQNGIVEVDRQGNILWEWYVWDHTIQDFDPTRGKYGNLGAPENWGKIDLNLALNDQDGLDFSWSTLNSIDYNPELDHIAINSRDHSEFYIIDHGATFVPADPAASKALAAGAAGDFIFRWGTPSNYRMGQKAECNHNRTAQIFGAHDIQWIREGTPGVGNFLIFDNGMFRLSERPRSAVLEIDVHDEEMGQYIWQHEAGYKVLDPPLAACRTFGVSPLFSTTALFSPKR